MTNSYLLELMYVDDELADPVPHLTPFSDRLLAMTPALAKPYRQRECRVPLVSPLRGETAPDHLSQGIRRGT